MRVGLIEGTGTEDSIGVQVLEMTGLSGIWDMNNERKLWGMTQVEKAMRQSIAMHLNFSSKLVTERLRK